MRSIIDRIVSLCVFDGVLEQDEIHYDYARHVVILLQHASHALLENIHVSDVFVNIVC